MAKMRLLQSACAAVMLAAMPAFAQTNSQPADTGAGGAPNNPMAVPNGAPSSAPAERMNSSHGSMGGKDMRASMDHGSGRHGEMHAMQMRRDVPTSQDAAVDELNNRSYEAARNGQAFNGSAPAAMSMPNGSGHMDNPSSGGSK